MSATGPQIRFGPGIARSSSLVWPQRSLRVRGDSVRTGGGRARRGGRVVRSRRGTVGRFWVSVHDQFSGTIEPGHLSTQGNSCHRRYVAGGGSDRPVMGGLIRAATWCKIGPDIPIRNRVGIPLTGQFRGLDFRRFRWRSTRERGPEGSVGQNKAEANAGRLCELEARGRHNNHGR